jgi:hypothetical protein
MAQRVLHVVNRTTGKLMRRSTTYPHHFVFVFELVSGAYRGRRGTLDELRTLVGEPLLLGSIHIAVCAKTGELLTGPEHPDVSNWKPLADIHSHQVTHQVPA